MPGMTNPCNVPSLCCATYAVRILKGSLVNLSLARFSELLALIHQAGTAPERWPEALLALRALLDGSRAALMDLDASNAFLGIAQVGNEQYIEKAYAEHYVNIDPTLHRSLVAPALQSLTVFQQFSKAERSRHEYFDFTERTCRIGDVVGSRTYVNDGRQAVLAVHRELDAPAYQEDEKILLGLIMPHIALAKRLHNKLEAALSARAELEAAFAKLTHAAFIVDGERRVRHANAAAEALLARQRQCVVRNLKLGFSEARLDSAFAKAVKEACAETGMSAALQVAIDGESAEVFIAPLHPTHRLGSPWGEPMVLIAIPRDPDEQYVAWRLRQLYRLTPAESRVAAALAMGKTMEAIAADHGVTEATLRSQLKSIFGKTGTSRQLELVRLALAGAAFR